MINVMTIDGFQAVVQFDPELNLLRGEFIGLNGGADFYAVDVEGLRREGATSLAVFLETCRSRGISPRKPYSGKLSLRLESSTHEQAATAAAAQGKSLNEWISGVIEGAVLEACTSRG
jgi:predicted HicB family RNase H-like nuclease